MVSCRKGREVVDPVDSEILMERKVLGLGVAERDFDMQTKQYARNKTNESLRQPQHIRDFGARRGEDARWLLEQAGKGRYVCAIVILPTKQPKIMYRITSNEIPLQRVHFNGSTTGSR